MAERSAYIKALEVDNSIPIDPKAVELWLADLDNPTRWTLRPLLQFVLSILLHITWYFKRLPLPQFSAHETLQKLICWFCKHLVSYEANMLILRHYVTESNLLNFLLENKTTEGVADQEIIEPVDLYPTCIEDMLEHSFVKHDQELFRLFAQMGPYQKNQNHGPNSLSWQHWHSLSDINFTVNKKPTQVLDFETAHALFMCLFCLLLKRDEYRDAINGFNLDQSIAIRIGDIVADNSLVEMAYNKHPLYLVGPGNLSQRFLMHGFFTEYLYATLESRRIKNRGQ